MRHYAAFFSIKVTSVTALKPISLLQSAEKYDIIKPIPTGENAMNIQNLPP